MATTSTAAFSIGTTFAGNVITPQHILHTAHLLGEDHVDQSAIQAIADYAGEHDGVVPETLDDLEHWLDATEMVSAEDGLYSTEESDDAAIESHTRSFVLQSSAPTLSSVVQDMLTDRPQDTHPGVLVDLLNAVYENAGPLSERITAANPAPKTETESPHHDANAQFVDRATIRGLLDQGTMSTLRTACTLASLNGADRNSGQSMTVAIERFLGSQEPAAPTPVRERKIEVAKPGQVKQDQRLRSVLTRIDEVMRLLAEGNVADLVTMTALQTAYARVKRNHTELLVRMGTEPVADAKAANSRTDVMDAKPAPKASPNTMANSPAANPVDPTPTPKPVQVKPQVQTQKPVAKTRGDGLAEYRKLQGACKAAGVSAKGKKSELEARLARHNTETCKAEATLAAAAKKATAPVQQMAATNAKTVPVEVPIDRKAFILQLLAMNDAQFSVVVGSVN